MRKLTILLLFIYNITNIYSIEDHLGITPEIAINILGSPEFCYTERGETPKEDDVVFFYKNRIYLYFNNNRVWQVRVDNKYSEPIGDIEIGNTKKQVIETLGEPIKVIENSIIYKLPDQGFHRYLRLYFSNDILDDIYLYRGDY
ncbi:MAG: hypothetical protein OCD02_16665 [Spirochaetaceae bacterium]